MIQGKTILAYGAIHGRSFRMITSYRKSWFWRYVYSFGEFSHGQNATYYSKTVVSQAVRKLTRRQQLNKFWFLRYGLCEVCRTMRQQKTRDDMVAGNPYRLS